MPRHTLRRSPLERGSRSSNATTNATDAARKTSASPRSPTLNGSTVFVFWAQAAITTSTTYSAARATAVLIATRPGRRALSSVMLPRSSAPACCSSARRGDRCVIRSALIIADRDRALGIGRHLEFFEVRERSGKLDLVLVPFLARFAAGIDPLLEIRRRRVVELRPARGHDPHRFRARGRDLRE